MADTEGTALAAVLAKQNEIQAAIVEAMMALKASQPPREVQFGDADYQAKLAALAKRFKTPVYQNNFDTGDPYDATGQSDQTIERVSRLRPGKYIKGKVEVRIDDSGAVRFYYSNKTPDQRFANMMEWRDFGDLVDRIWAEMQAAA